MAAPKYKVGDQCFLKRDPVCGDNGIYEDGIFGTVVTIAEYVGHFDRVHEYMLMTSGPGKRSWYVTERMLEPAGGPW